MAKKKLKKFLKKAAKAALIGGALYAGVKGLGKRGLKGNVSKTAATEGIKYTPGPQIPDAPFIKRRKKWDLGPDTGPDAFAAKGGRISKKDGGRTGKQFGGGLTRRVGGVGAPVRPLAYKHGGKVKSMGIATRGGGVAKR
jgi:hypothetical protein